MARPKRWEEAPLENGIGEVKIVQWRYFMDYVYQKMLDYETYIWRGQRCSDWTLETTLDRLIAKAKVAKTKRYQFRRTHLEQFKFACRGRRGINPPVIESENEWWALGQHHGLATPLLDWTTSPFAAAYFAFINTGENQTRYRAIYALHKPSIEAKVADIKKRAEAANEVEKAMMPKPQNALSLVGRGLLNIPVAPEVEFIRPMSDENQRLVNQGGLFSRAPDETTLEEWIASNFVGDSRGYTLMKILIPNRDRDTCLQTLNRMNINHLTLFPDLYGASKFCNVFGEIKKY